MSFGRKFKMGLFAALGIMSLAIIAGIVALALTLVQDTTEDTPIGIVGETAGAAAGSVSAVGETASGPLDPEPVAADSAPSKPDSISASRSSGSVAVGWSTVTGADTYDADYREGTDSTTPWSTLASATTDNAATLSSATNASSYYFRVRASNQYGDSDWLTSSKVPPFIPTPRNVSGHQATEVWTVTALWGQPTGVADTTTYTYDIEFSDDNGSTWFGCKTGTNVTTDERCDSGENSYGVVPSTIISIEEAISLDVQIQKLRIRTSDGTNVSAWVVGNVDAQYG